MTEPGPKIAESKAPDYRSAGGESPPRAESIETGTDRRKTLLICAVLLLAAAAITLVIFTTEPEAEKSGATKTSAMLVEVLIAREGDYTPTIRAVGTVEPAREIVLSPRVEGRVVELHPGFIPGGFVDEGEPLLRIDAADYRHQLAQRRNELRQARADLAIEQGRVDVAERDYELLDGTIEGNLEEDLDLVLRKPQLESARARVDSAETAVAQAELALARTAIEAPFDAHVISRTVNVGSQVSPGQTLARLVGRESYWVAATVPLRKLPWLEFPTDSEEKPGSEVVVRSRTAWQENENRQGHLFRLIGALAEETRLARVLIAVPDPLAVLPANEGKPRLIIGAFVEVAISGRGLENVVRIERDYIREGDKVWVMADGTLEIRPVEIVMEDAEYAYIRAGVKDGEKVVTSNLAAVTAGAELRVQDPDGKNEPGEESGRAAQGHTDAAAGRQQPGDNAGG